MKHEMNEKEALKIAYDALADALHYEDEYEWEYDESYYEDLKCAMDKIQQMIIAR